MRELNTIQTELDDLTGKLESAAERFSQAEDAEARTSASDEVKALSEQFDALAQERDVASAQARMNEVTEAWNEVAERRVENGGDLSYRRDTAEIRDASDLEVETPEVRAERAELWERYRAGDSLTDEENSKRMRRTAEDKAFIRYLQTDDASDLLRVRAEMQRADTVTTSTNVSTVPTLVANMVEDKKAHTGPMREICRVERAPTASPVNYPVLDKTGDDATFKAEGAASDDADALPMKVINVTAYTMRNKPLVLAREVVRDSAPRLEAEVTGYFGDRIGRGVNKFITVGTGKSMQPLGVLNADSANKIEAITGSFTQNAQTGRVHKTGGATTAPDLDDLIDMIGKVDYAYQSGANVGFIMNQSTAVALRKIKVSTSDNRYVWEPSVQAGQPDRFAGFPVWINNAVAETSTSGARSVAFGNWGYQVIHMVDNLEIVRSDHSHIGQNSVAFYGTQSVGGSFLAIEPFVVALQAS